MDAFSHILTPTHFGDLQHHSDSFNTFTPSNSEMFCTHVHHFQMFYHMSRHHHQHISKYLTSSTHVLYVARTFAHMQTHISSYPIIFQVHYIAYPNVFLHESTRTPNIWYYPRTARRIFATSLEAFENQFTLFLSIPNTLIHISEYFYCTRMRIHAFSNLHSSLSIQHLSPIY